MTDIVKLINHDYKTCPFCGKNIIQPDNSYTGYCQCINDILITFSYTNISYLGNKYGPVEWIKLRKRGSNIYLSIYLQRGFTKIWKDPYIGLTGDLQINNNLTLENIEKKLKTYLIFQ